MTPYTAVLYYLLSQKPRTLQKYKTERNDISKPLSDFGLILSLGSTTCSQILLLSGMAVVFIIISLMSKLPRGSKAAKFSLGSLNTTILQLIRNCGKATMSMHASCFSFAKIERWEPKAIFDVSVRDHFLPR